MDVLVFITSGTLDFSFVALCTSDSVLGVVCSFLLVPSKLRCEIRLPSTLRLLCSQSYPRLHLHRGPHDSIVMDSLLF